MRVCELRYKEVINCRDGMKIGHIFDLDIDICTGKICAFIIPGPSKVCGIWGREEEYIIPFQCVKQIGVDVIIVDVDIKAIRKKCC